MEETESEGYLLEDNAKDPRPIFRFNIGVVPHRRRDTYYGGVEDTTSS